MVPKFSAHTHTKYCDGADSVFDMTRAAFEKGFSSLGFSSHCVSVGDCPGLTKENYRDYLGDIKKVKSEYSERLDILAGIELDDEMDNTLDLSDLDYYIAGIHSLKAPLNGKRYSVDNTRRELEQLLNDGFGADSEAMVKSYFESYSDFVVKKSPAFATHIDLIRKLNKKDPLFDEDSKVYNDSAFLALEKIKKHDIVLEINTGAMSRGYLDSPYPSKKLLSFWRGIGGEITYSSDAHSVSALDYGFPAAISLAKECGFKRILSLTSSGFLEYEL